MFGYIKPYTPDLLVREHELYRAVYCGLCRAMSHNTGCMSCMALSYDFVFLATVRMVAEGNRPKAEYRRCLVHPIKKRPSIIENPSLVYCAASAARLKLDKIRDDISDESGLKKIGAALLLPEAKLAFKRSQKLNFETADTSIHLSKLSEIERQKTASIDQGADIFGDLLGDVFACGLSHSEETVCREIGREVGRFIYALDAAKDLADDVKSGRYNPIYELWGKDSYDEEKKSISDAVGRSVYNSLLVSLGRLAAAVELLDTSEVPELEGIIKNTVYLGMPHEAKTLITHQIDNKE